MRVSAFSESARGVAVAIVVIFAGASAGAQDHDAQIWLTGSTKISLDDKWSMSGEVNVRFNNLTDRLGQTQLKLNLVRDIGAGVSLTAGYGHMISHNENMPDRHENRLWQAIGWEFLKTDNYAFATRTQLEERFINGDAGWRLRQRISLKRTISKKMYVYGSGEGYFFLNDTRWGAQSGFEQLRIGAGLGVHLRDGMALETGYLNRLKIVRDAEDEMSHIIGVTLKFRP
ncbi:DUF2490 domain-containing protein [Hyphococcus sp.]|uniref:DUF2490 domain-containing protein n=1 Tax=Hyphococcus sp. TaxID=2038636 RepID=UPI003CCBAAB8